MDLSTSPAYVVMACHLTGVYDVNRNNTLPDDDFGLVQDWAHSLRELGLTGILFHNNFTEQTCQKHQNEHLRFVKVDYDQGYKPNVYRYFVYRDYLQVHAPALKGLFLTDVSDVVALQNPFQQPLFLEHPDTLFCGDEPTTLHNPWMLAHGAHLRQNMADYAAFETAFQAATLLNCGIIGGHLQVMQAFLAQLCHIHQQYNYNNQTAYTGDMGAFNYLARTQFQNHLWHGPPVNTVFKGYETQRGDCWFRHK